MKLTCCLLLGLAFAAPAFADQLSLGPNVDAVWQGSVSHFEQASDAGEITLANASPPGLNDDRIRSANFDDAYGPWHVTVLPSATQPGYEYISQCAVAKSYAVDCGLLVQLTCVDEIAP